MSGGQMLTRRTVILKCTESTYGTDPAYAGFTPLLAWDVDLDVRGEMLERSTMRDTLSPMPHSIGMKDVQVTFKTELKANAAGTKPEMHELLLACGFVAASASGDYVKYSPVAGASTFGSVSLFVYKDGNVHKVNGSRGSVVMNLEAGKYGVCEWTMQGLYTAVAAATVPDMAAADTAAPPILYNSSFNIAGFSPVCSSMKIDLGNEVVRRVDLNAATGVREFRITGRKPVMEFNADAVVEASNPFWGDWVGAVTDTFGVVAGSGTAGKEVFIYGYFTYEKLKYGDADGISQYECVARLCSSDVNSNDDDLILHFT